jgi:NTE family protein
MPYLIQYFVNSLGRDAASCSDLMSYLLFTSKYTRDLIELGYHDADDRIAEIEDYLFSNGSSTKGAGPSRNGKSRDLEPASRRGAAALRS